MDHMPWMYYTLNHHTRICTLSCAICYTRRHHTHTHTHTHTHDVLRSWHHVMGMLYTPIHHTHNIRSCTLYIRHTLLSTIHTAYTSNPPYTLHTPLSTIHTYPPYAHHALLSTTTHTRRRYRAKDVEKDEKETVRKNATFCLY